MIKAEITEKLFNAISQFITDSRESLQKGEVVELTGLEGQVGTLCDAIMRLSDEERAIYATRLQELMTGLQVLGEELVAQRDKVEDEMRGLTQVKKANTAYRTAEASDNYTKSDEE
jgi:hypothetical protein